MSRGQNNINNSMNISGAPNMQTVASAQQQPPESREERLIRMKYESMIKKE